MNRATSAGSIDLPATISSVRPVSSVTFSGIGWEGWRSAWKGVLISWILPVVTP